MLTNFNKAMEKMGLKPAQVFNEPELNHPSLEKHFESLERKYGVVNESTEENVEEVSDENI